jgi:hypothetical protein
MKCWKPYRLSPIGSTGWWGIKMLVCNRRCNCRWSIVLTTLILGFLLFLILSRSYSSSPGFVGFIELRTDLQELVYTKSVAVQPCTRKLDRWGVGGDVLSITRHSSYLCIDSSPDRSHRRLRTFRRSYRKENFTIIHVQLPEWMYNPHSSGREIPFGTEASKEQSMDMTPIHERNLISLFLTHLGAS